MNAFQRSLSLAIVGLLAAPALALAAPAHTVTDLGTLGGTESYATTIYAAGSPLDLNNLIVPHPGPKQPRAYGINIAMQIVGPGKIGGPVHPFPLTPVTPVPAPAAVWLFGSGLVGLRLVRRRPAARRK